VFCPISIFVFGKAFLYAHKNHPVAELFSDRDRGETEREVFLISDWWD
jgi:hypothetical protein